MAACGHFQVWVSSCDCARDCPSSEQKQRRSSVRFPADLSTSENRFVVYSDIASSGVNRVDTRGGPIRIRRPPELVVVHVRGQDCVVVGREGGDSQGRRLETYRRASGDRACPTGQVVGLPSAFGVPADWSLAGHRLQRLRRGRRLPSTCFVRSSSSSRSRSEAGPAPQACRKTFASPECQLADARSFFPSLLKSAIATENGVRLSATVAPALKVPLPLPRRMVNDVGAEPFG